MSRSFTDDWGTQTQQACTSQTDAPGSGLPMNKNMNRVIIIIITIIGTLLVIIDVTVASLYAGPTLTCRFTRTKHA